MCQQGSVWGARRLVVGFTPPRVVFRTEERVGGGVWGLHHLRVIFGLVREAEAVKRRRVGYTPPPRHFRGSFARWRRSEGGHMGSTPPPCSFRGVFARRRRLGGGVWGIRRLCAVIRCVGG